MEPSPTTIALKDLHGDLSRKYKIHGAKIETIWRSFDRHKRAKCFTAGAADGVVLQHSQDTSMGAVYKFVPELNLRDITEPGSDFLLDLLRHRSTTSLVEQYRSGPAGGLGDHAFILEMMRTRNLRHAEAFPNCYTLFTELEYYGSSIKIVKERAGVLAALQPAIRAGLCVPQSTGELILNRQLTLLQTLNIIIEDILDEGSESRARGERPTKSSQPATTAAAFSKLAIKPPPQKLALPDLITSASDQESSTKEYLGLLSTEPVVLSHAVNITFFSRPELVPDEKGRALPVHTDRYISGAFFEAVHSAVKAAAIWSYIGRLLELLDGVGADKAYRAVVLQEISNVCYLEYGRAQDLLKRYLQTGSASKRFKRVSGAFDKVGNARVTMKGKPEDLTRDDPQLHYMLRLCQTETTPTKAADWMKKLSDLHAAHPLERDRLAEREVDALSDLVVIVAFIQDISPVVSMPSFSRKKGQMFVSRVLELEAELNLLKPKIDLRDFAVPIDNLLEPGMAEAALKALEQFVTEEAGTKMGFLYQDLINECLSGINDQRQRLQDQAEQPTAEWSPLPAPSAQPTEKRLEERRQKEKTRPTNSSVYDIAPQPVAHGTEDPVLQPQTLKVSTATAEVFTTLFAKSLARGSVNWTAFESAMVNIGFSVVPKFGSVYAFLPPDTLVAKKPLTLHRPHGSRIEGYMIPIVARRLKKVYGWDETTFEVV